MPTAAIAIAGIAALVVAVLQFTSQEPEPVAAPTVRDPGALVRGSATEEITVVPIATTDVGVKTADAAPDVRAGTARPGAVPSIGCGEPAPALGHGVFGRSHRFLPSAYDGTTPLPLVVMLHSDYQDPADFMDSTDFPTRAERDHLILVALTDDELLGRVWRDGDEDVAKVVAGVDLAFREFCVDRARVFMLGHGDGGRMAHRVSCSPFLAGLAVNGFSLNAGGYLCDVPVPTLWLHPMESAHFPTDGSDNCSGRPKRTPDEMEKLWHERNRCRGAGDVTVTYGESSCRRWACEAGFEMCRLDGGVPWPGTSGPPAFTELMGCPPDRAPDFPVAARVWEFFVHAPPLAKVPETL